MSVEELHPEKNSIWNRWKATAIEWLAVVISCATFVISLIALVFGIHANVKTSYQDVALEEQRDNVGVLRIRQAKMDAWLKAHGVPVEEIYNDVSR